SAGRATRRVEARMSSSRTRVGWLIGVLLVVGGCNRSLPNADLSDMAMPRSVATPIFYATVDVGSNRRDGSDQARLSAQLSDLDRPRAIVDGPPLIPIQDGEHLSLNGIELVAGAAALTYEAHNIPLAPDGKYQFVWSTPSGTVTFYPAVIVPITL